MRVDASGKIWVDVEGIPHQAGQAAMLESLDLLGPFNVADRRGPDLIRPRPSLRIVPGRVSGEPHLARSRITTLSVAALDPGFDAAAFRDAVEFESSLAA